MNHQAVLDLILTWARDNDTIRALVLTGSLARDNGSADEHSDLDIELYVTDPSALLEHDAWYHGFGKVLVVEALENPDWNPTRLVYYHDGKIDFMIAPAGILAEGVVYDRPFRLLIDKDTAAAAFQPVPRDSQLPPTAAQFLETVNFFYAAAIMWAKYLARDDPWAAKVRDWESKTHLLQMLEWDHKARKGWDYDTWYLGIRLREWMDPDLMPSVERCWSDLSIADSSRALRVSLALFDTLGTRTATTLGFVPFDSTRVRERVENLLRGR
jgi:aminoglycoside 6-adenylyltransferase